MSNYSDFLDSLAKRESRGNQNAINSLGYIGLYQMGEAALVDAGYITNDGHMNNNYESYSWTGVDGISSYSEFLASVDAQNNAASAYHDRLLGYLESNGATSYIGQTVDGIEITQSGLIGSAHLVGAGAVSNWLSSSSGSTPVDGNGTTSSEYLDLFGGYDVGSFDPNDSRVSDIDGDGFATDTAWVDADDGFLVMDRNQNGTIDNINELFGNTVQDGFAELRTLDSNQDGLINSRDEQYSDLLIWQDENSDGVSQHSELRSLAAHNISRIDLASTPVNLEIEGTAVIAEGHYSRVDAEGNETTHLIADIQLLNDPTFSEFVGQFELDDGVLRWGNIDGYGRLPDFHVAMSLDAELKSMVDSLLEVPDVNTLPAGFEQVLYRWAGVESISINDIDSAPLLSADADGVVNFTNAGVALTVQQLGTIKAYVGVDNLRIGDGQWQANGEIQTTGNYYQIAWQMLYNNLLAKFAVSSGLLDQVLPELQYDEVTDQLVLVSGVGLDMAQSRLIDNLDFSDQQSVGDVLLAEFVLAQIDERIIDRFSQSPAALVDDLGIEPTQLHQLIANPLFTLLSALPVSRIAEGKQGSSQSEYIVGTHSHDLLNGLQGDDYLVGFQGDDTINTGYGTDIAYGGEGNDDIIAGYQGSKVLYGDAGNDLLKIARINSRDAGRYAALEQNIFSDGEGNDRLEGWTGADTYRFNRGDGEDVINDDDYGNYTVGYSYSSKSFNKTDRIELGEGIGRDDLFIHRVGNDLVVDMFSEGEAVGDRIMVEKWYSHDRYRIEEIVLAD